MKNILKPFLLRLVPGIVLFILLPTVCDHVTAREQPNVLLIITDDQGYGDLGMHGNKILQTPNIDQLAKQSVEFTQFYASPVCAPTRASIMTGRYNMRTGVYDTYNGGAIMAGSEYTLAEILKDNGYTTAIFGKWHLGDNYPYRPQDQGFDEVLIHGAGGIGQPGDHIDNFRRWHQDSYFSPILYHNGKPEKFDGYCSDVFTSQAIEFIHKNNHNPFFVYMAYNAPHEPHQCPDEYVKIYENMAFESGMNKDEKRKDETNIVYGMITNIDYNVGRLIHTVDSLKLLENTIVIFMTDNGPWQTRYNAGLRGLKGTVYEGGIRVPFIISYGKKIPKNQFIDIPVAHIDILPTLLELCNISPSNQVDGLSLVPLLNGNVHDIFSERYIVHEHQRDYLAPYFNISVRKGDFKLIGNCSHDAKLSDFELYNIKSDPYETMNISLSKPDLTAEYKNYFDSWYQEMVNEENIKNPLPVIIGSEFENPVVLTRNDMRGIGGKLWTNEHAAGYWDIMNQSKGTFTFRLTFVNPVPERMISIMLNQKKYMFKHNEDNGTIIECKNITLDADTYHLQCWYDYWSSDGPQIISPLYIEIERIK